MVIVSPSSSAIETKFYQKELNSYVPDRKNGFSANSQIHEIAKPYNKIHINHFKTIKFGKEIGYYVDPSRILLPPN
jgi:hypothetical protein